MTKLTDQMKGNPIVIEDTDNVEQQNNSCVWTELFSA